MALAASMGRLADRSSMVSESGKLVFNGTNRSGAHALTEGLRYTVGDATVPQSSVSPQCSGSKSSENQIIVHVCNDVGGWGRGFVVALSARWPQPEEAYLQWFEARSTNDFALGAIQLVAVESSIWVANLIGQRDVVGSPDGPPVRYEAIDRGLTLLASAAKERQASVHMPRIGCGLAGGEWDAIESIVQRTLVDDGVSVTVYDLPRSA